MAAESRSASFRCQSDGVGGSRIQTMRGVCASHSDDWDSAEDLDRLAIPGLWIYSDNDGSIPVDLSIARLRDLKHKGHAFDYVLLPGLGHNNMSGTFPIATDWIRRKSLLAGGRTSP
jgi:pimeloyl-ACP methyl ester carboxylesterase